MSSNTSTRPLVVLDCDSTTIQDEVIELLAEVAGTHDRVAEITDRAMRGELDFRESLRDRVATLAGTPESVFAQTIERVRLTPGIRELIAEVHSRGGKVGVVSGGFHEVLDEIAEDLGIDFWRANRLEVVDGMLTGRTVGPIIDARAKAETLREWAAHANIPHSATVAIGDGANDLEMMDIAALSIGFNAKQIVVERADVAITEDLREAIKYFDQLS